MAVTVKAYKRGGRTKSALSKLRKKGHVPCVIYGKGTDNVTVAVDERQMTKVLRDEGNYAVLKLDVEDDQSYQVMVYEIQKDPIKQNLVHIDFKTIRMDELVDSEVGIAVVGEAAGVGDGGILQQSLRALEIRSLPHERPETIEVDVSELNIGDSIAVADLNVPEGVEVLNHPEETVISIVRPAEEEEEEEKAAPAEPELVDEKASEEQESDAE